MFGVGPKQNNLGSGFSPQPHPLQFLALGSEAGGLEGAGRRGGGSAGAEALLRVEVV